MAQSSTALARDPHALFLDTAIHLAAAPMLLKEDIEGVPESHQGFGTVTDPASLVDDHNRIHTRTCVKLFGLMGRLSNTPVGEQMNACKLCGETRTFSRTYTVMQGPTYTLRYFTCKHPLTDATTPPPSSTVNPTNLTILP